YLLEIHLISADIEEPLDKINPIGRAGNGNLTVAANDDGVAVVAVVAPAPERGFAHEHERRDLIKSVVHPVGLERGSVPCLMPARVGAGRIDSAVDRVGEDGPPAAPQGISGISRAEDEREPENGVANRGTIAALQK